MANKRDSELHKGHRQRIKERADNFGLSAFCEHEALELLLTYVIPRRDLNETAHILLKTFGSFYNIVHADKQDIMKIKGLDPESALFLKLFPQFFDLYRESKRQGRIKLNNTFKSVEYFKDVIGVDDEIEEAYLAMLNDRDELIKLISIGVAGSSHEVEIDEDLLAKECGYRRPKKILLFHTHPKGRVFPSNEDLSTTARIMEALKIHQVDVADHIILNAKEFYSLKDNNIISELNTIINSKLGYLKLTDPRAISSILESAKKDSSN